MRTADERSRIRNGEDREVSRPEDREQAGSSALQQFRFGARAVVGWGVGEDDVADREPMQPREVRVAPELPVEDVVLRKIVLAEPAARKRDPGFWKVDGGPVAERVDRLDAVRLPEVGVQVRDR